MKNICRKIGCIAIVLCQCACAHGDYRPVKPVPDKTVESSVTFLKDGSVVVTDSEGNVIEGIPEREFFSCRDTTECEGVGVDKILGIKSPVVSMEIKGSHYTILKSGHLIYKIPLDAPHP